MIFFATLPRLRFYCTQQMFARLQSVCLRLMPKSGSVSIFGFGSRPQRLLNMYQCPRTTRVRHRRKRT